MAIQGFTTGGQGVLLMAPVNISTTGVATLATPLSTLPASMKDLYDGFGLIDKSKNLELTVFSSKLDEVGIVSTSPSFDATPKSIAFTIDRDDLYSLRFMQRYCLSLRCGIETPAEQAGTTTAKEYEDGTTVRGDTTPEEEVIKPENTIFFAWLGPKMRGDKSITENNIKLEIINTTPPTHNKSIKRAKLEIIHNELS